MKTILAQMKRFLSVGHDEDVLENDVLDDDEDEEQFNNFDPHLDLRSKSFWVSSTTRKPNDFSQVHKIRAGIPSAKEIKWIESLPVYDLLDLWNLPVDDPLPHPFDSFVRKVPAQYFVLDAKINGVYFINTEGYNFCKYVTNLSDLSLNLKGH